MSATQTIDPISSLTRDLRDASKLLSVREARYLVDAYYTIQDYRKASGNQIRALAETEEPHQVIRWLFAQMETLESQIRRALEAWSGEQALGQWARSICGIGPVIAAGLLAHIDIEKAPTASHIWRFAGLDPTMKWGKGEKRPWNAALKTLCWKIGESFVKVSNLEQDFYGKLYRQRRALEEERNAQGLYREQAEAILAAKRIRKTTDAYAAYSQGRLPPGHLHARAKRWAVKLFLSHYQHVGWHLKFGEPPPKPYAFSHLGHGDFIPPPNWPT